MDHREADIYRWWESISQDQRFATIRDYYEDEWLEDYEEGQEPAEIRIPIKWVVCPCCDGRGSYVNPGVDSHGLSADDFYEDPEFAEDYWRGNYDVTCDTCRGQRVVPSPANKDDAEKVDRILDGLYSEAVERSYAQRMGF